MDGPRLQALVWIYGLLSPSMAADVGSPRREGPGLPSPLCQARPMPGPDQPLAPQGTHRATLREVVGGAAQEVGPAPLPLHDGTGASGRLAEGAAGQLHPVILTLGHVHSTQQGLDHCPASGGVPEACGVMTVWTHCSEDPSSFRPTGTAAPLSPRPKASVFASLQATTARGRRARCFSTGHVGRTILCCRTVPCLAEPLALQDPAH